MQVRNDTQKIETLAQHLFKIELERVRKNVSFVAANQFPIIIKI